MVAQPPSPPDAAIVWHVFYARDGLEVRVRPELPSDAANLIDLFGHLSPNSRYLRFSKSMVSPDPQRVQQEAEHLVELQPPKDVAWLAFADLPGQPDTPIAGVRYTRLDGDTAELAIVVRDDFHRRGIGTELLKFLTEQARRDGIRELVATFRTENRAVWELLKHSPYPVKREIHGPEVDAVIDLMAEPA